MSYTESNKDWTPSVKAEVECDEENDEGEEGRDSETEESANPGYCFNLNFSNPGGPVLFRLPKNAVSFFCFKYLAE